MYTWKERLADWWARISVRWDLTREVWMHIGISAGIALALTGIILAIVLPGVRADINEQVGQFATNITAMQADWESHHDELQLDVEADLDDQWQYIGQTLGQHGDTIAALSGQLDGMQGQVDNLDTNELSINLTGAFPGYVLHARSAHDGVYAATFHLCYPGGGIGNSTNYTAVLDYFYTGINWTVPVLPNYVCQPAFNGTVWKIVDVWFQIEPFELVSGAVLELPINCPGLNSTWTVDYAYVQLFRWLAA